VEPGAIAAETLCKSIESPSGTYSGEGDIFFCSSSRSDMTCYGEPRFSRRSLLDNGQTGTALDVGYQRSYLDTCKRRMGRSRPSPELARERDGTISERRTVARFKKIRDVLEIGGGEGS